MTDPTPADGPLPRPHPWARGAASTPVRRHVRPSDARDADGYRHDIDGLRAVAILLVVVYHVWFGRVSGGVDVFLMLSAFFLTASFAKRIRAGRALDLPGYWARTFKRLVPASAVLLVAVLAMTWALLPGSMWPAVWRETVASLAYFQNWELATSAVDYYARDGAVPSPLQHYWSLSVQGQVFVLFPVLLAVAAIFLRGRSSRTITRTLVVLFGVIFAGSFVFSVLETSSRQEFAYFDTRTRLWEFALGALVALLLPWIRIPRALGRWLVVGGLAAIVSCGLVLDVQGGFPGYYALWPTLAAAAVIVGGAAHSTSAPTRLLAHPVLRRLGRDAYALYLVHWPLLVLYISSTGSRPSFLPGLAIVVASLLLARLLTALVENPVRRMPWAAASPLRSFAVVGVAAVVVVAPLTAWQHHEQARVDAVLAQADAANPGAMTMLPGFSASDPLPGGSPAIPLASALEEQWVELPSRCQGDARPRDPDLRDHCRELVPEGPASRTVAVVGDSHAQQMLGALVPLAEEEGWHVVALLRGGCSFGLGEHPCRDWNEDAVEYVLDLAPDALFTIATAAETGGPDEEVVPGFHEVATRLTDAGVDVVGVRDNPRFDFDVYACAETAGSDPGQECGVEVSEALAPSNPLLDDDELAGLVRPVDLSDLVCPDGFCAPIVGNVYVYLDDNHLTWDYARTLAPFLRERLGAV